MKIRQGWELTIPHDMSARHGECLGGIDPLAAMADLLFDAFEADEDERRDPVALEAYRKAAQRMLGHGEVLDSRPEARL